MTRYWAHATAIIDEPATIGRDTKIWHFAHVMAGARIGAGCSLGQNTFVGARASIGDGCKLQNNVSIYDGVALGDRVFVGPSAVFTNVRNPRAAIARKDAYAPTWVGDGATIGANATIVCGVTIGQHALVAAGAVVTHDVAPFALVVGVPARRTGWVCTCGVTLPRARGAAKARTSLTCAACGARFRLAGTGARARLAAVSARRASSATRGG